MSTHEVAFTRYQKLVVFLLSILQFTIILDFMILSPLGAILMPQLKIDPEHFGYVVSIYAFSAGISGFLAAGYADRYDRKKLLLFFYTGFLVGTLLCALSPNYIFLLLARMVTGLFGGVIASVVSAITTDLFTFEVRGRVMGFIQTAFAASQILGIPAGLYFSNLWGWHAPFVMIVLMGVLIGFVIWFYLKPVDKHLSQRVDRHPVHHLKKTISTPKYMLAFSATALLSLGGFLLMPFGSAFSVHNLGVPLDKLPLVYLVTGISTMFIGPIVGRASDAFGKFNTFFFGTVVTIIMVLIYTNLGLTPIPVVMLINSILFVGIFSRMIPAQALMSAIPEAADRGAFMSIGSSLQQISGGIASLIAGLIVIEAAGGKLIHFNILGYLMVGFALVALTLMFYVHKLVKEK